MLKRIRAEFHIHTRYSKDSFLNGLFLFVMLKIKHIDCVAITDHNEINGAVKYGPRFEKHGITVIIGEEIFSKDGEIIGLYLHERIKPGMSAEETVSAIKEQNGIVYVPHPYDKKRNKTVLTPEAFERVKDYVDIVEIHNGRNISGVFSKEQKEIADKYKKTPVVGSDAHTFFEIGRNVCILEFIDRERLVLSLNSAEFIKSDCLWLSHRWTKVPRVIKKVIPMRIKKVFGRG